MFAVGFWGSMASGSGGERPSQIGPAAAWDVSVLGERKRPGAGPGGVDWDVSVPVEWPDRAIAEIAAVLACGNLLLAGAG